MNQILSKKEKTERLSIEIDNYELMNFLGNNTSGCAVITGASSGLGKEFAIQLAEQGFSTILIARRKDRLEDLKKELTSKYQNSNEILVADLSKMEDIQKIVDYVNDLENLEVLINNAGFGSQGNFADNNFEVQLQMLDVHVTASVHLCRAVLSGMIARKTGAIINLSSLGAYLPAVGAVMYSATKAFLKMFSESIAMELRGTGVKIQALCPSFTVTEFHEVGEYKGYDRTKIPKFLWMNSEEVIRISLASFKKNKTIVIPGRKNRIFRWALEAPLIGKYLKNALSKERIEPNKIE
jgi:uncharacterized protein